MPNILFINDGNDTKVFLMVQDRIHVPALMDEERVVVPETWLDSVPYQIFIRGRIFSAADYLRFMELPTVAELRHAFFDSRDGTVIRWRGVIGKRILLFEKINYVPLRNDYVSPEYREHVFSGLGRGEWTSTLKKPRRPKKGEVVPKGYSPITVIHFDNDTDRLFRNPETGLWEIEYDSSHAFDICAPPRGWVLDYNKETGLPSVTSPRKKDAQMMFGDDASYVKWDRGLRVVARISSRRRGPFYIDASHRPGQSYLHIDARLCERSNPSSTGHFILGVYTPSVD